MCAVFVGETRFPRDFKRYSRQYSFLELDCEPGSVPGKSKLQSCAATAPEGFVFSLVVPGAIANLGTGEESAKAWKSAQQVARVLRARWWVVRTPSDVRPTTRARQELGALFERLKESGMRVAWEPRGLWESDTAGATADALGVYLVQDVGRELPRAGKVLYTRLLALGKAARIGLSLADRVAQRAHAFEEAFVAVEGKGAQEIQKALGAEQALDELDAQVDELELEGDDASAEEHDEGDLDDEDQDDGLDEDDEDDEEA